LTGSSLEENKFLYSFIAPNYRVFQKIINNLEEKDFDPEVLKIEKYSPQGKELTLKQEKLLWLALKMGFFEIPRKINSRDISRKLGISLSNFSEIQRRGLKNLLENHFMK
jgi:predicted DNA binding protein